MTERIRLGKVYVESGQLLITDPVHLADWDGKKAFDEVCDLTLQPPGWGELQWLNGRPGKGIAFEIPGDDVYEVFGTFEDSRLVRVEIECLGRLAGEDDKPEDDPWA